MIRSIAFTAVLTGRPLVAHALFAANWMVMLRLRLHEEAVSIPHFLKTRSYAYRGLFRATRNSTRLTGNYADGSSGCCMARADRWVLLKVFLPS